MKIFALLVRAGRGPRGGVSSLLIAACALGLMVWPRAAVAEVALTRQRVASLLKAGPASEAVRAEVSGAVAAAKEADVLSLENPVVTGLGGARFNADGSRPFSAVGALSWPLELGGKRAARTQAAGAQVSAVSAHGQLQERELLLAALLQHACVLRDEQQLVLASERHALSARLLGAAERRKAAGSVPELDVTLAALQEKRDASLVASARGERDGDREALLALLGGAGADAIGADEASGADGARSPGAEVAGSLVPDETVPPLAQLLASAERQARVQSAAAAVEAARARYQSERAARSPTVSLLAQYERDDGANIGLLGLSVPIPVLNRNRAEVVSSGAEVTSTKARLRLERASAVGQLRTLYARYAATKGAVTSLEPTARLAARAVQLATRGYELGENDLASVLMVRREAVEAEAALLEALFAHAAVKLELLVMSGRQPQ
jgi:outer membrane protein, heavy metal efflux system